MFYQGFYKKAGELAKANLADVELPEQEGVKGPLSKQQVIDYLNDAINNGGYKLVEDFRLLWQYTNELTAKGNETTYPRLLRGDAFNVFATVQVEKFSAISFAVSGIIPTFAS